jgi:outer membrane protein assembly factor BamB
MITAFARAAVLPLAAGLVAGQVSAQEWSRFRGPEGSGISSEQGFPTRFDPANAVWRTPIRSGKSSPVLSRRHIFAVGFEDGHFYTQCFDRETGKLLWERAEPRPGRRPEHRFNEPASSTPVTDGENVYVFFKDIGLISYDAEGRRRWQVSMGPFTNHMGLASSPILADGLLIMQIDQSVGSYLAAYQPDTGEEVWKVSRPEHDSWATPFVLRHPAGTTELVMAASGHFAGHRLRDGERLWSHAGTGPAVVASPVAANDTVFGFGYGYESPVPFGPTLERYDRNGDGVLDADEFGEDAWLLQVSGWVGDQKPPVTSEEWYEAFRRVSTPSAILAVRLETIPGEPRVLQPRTLWRVERSLIGVVPSPLVLDKVLYVVRNGGIMAAFDAESGTQLKMARLGAATGSYSASPVAAEGRLYLASEDGQVVVVQAGREWEVLGVSDIGEAIYATPALSRGRVYVRAANHLYAFGSDVSLTNR